MNLPVSRLLEAVSKGMLSEASQRFLWTYKGLRFIYCFKELVVSSLERWEKVRGNTCTAVLTFEMPSMISLSWWFISQHKGRDEGPGQLPRLCVQSWMCFICVVKRLVWEWAGRGWLQKASSVDVQLSTSQLLLSQHWDEIDQDQADGELNLFN